MNLVTLLGIRARNPAELLAGIRHVPVSSIYYHTHRFLQQHHYLSPEPTNDFAYWLTNILNLKDLGEAFACVDTVSFSDLEALRATFVRILMEHAAGDVREAACPEGEEFHFMACYTFIMSIPYVAHDLQEFAGFLEQISIDSLYFHIFEARLRLGRDENDFSAWFKALGRPDLAGAVARLDPYTFTMDGLRKMILKTVRRHVAH